MTFSWIHNAYLIQVLRLSTLEFHILYVHLVSTAGPHLEGIRMLPLLLFMWEVPLKYQKRLLRCFFIPRNRLASGRDDPYFFRMMQRNFNSIKCLELLYDLRLFLHYLFSPFLILALYPGYRPGVNIESVRIEKAIGAQRRGGVVSMSLYDLGWARACVSLGFGGRLGDGRGGWQTPRPSNEDVTKYTFLMIHRL